VVDGPFSRGRACTKTGSITDELRICLFFFLSFWLGYMSVSLPQMTRLANKARPFLSMTCCRCASKSFRAGVEADRLADDGAAGVEA
jgi:hypothetical protein